MHRKGEEEEAPEAVNPKPLETPGYGASPLKHHSQDRRCCCRDFAAAIPAAAPSWGEILAVVCGAPLLAEKPFRSVGPTSCSTLYSPGFAARELSHNSHGDHGRCCCHCQSLTTLGLALFFFFVVRSAASQLYPHGCVPKLPSRRWSGRPHHGLQAALVVLVLGEACRASRCRCVACVQSRGYEPG